MKKIFNMMMAMAIAGFTFTACEDVPEPYNNPYDGYNKNQEPEVVIEPSGSGTLEDPYNVAKALEICAETGETETSEAVYAKGVITSISEISTSYGNATFMISDDSKGNNSLTVYRTKGLNNEPIADENLISKGDTVVICGKLVNYKGNTPEFTQGCYIVSVTKGEGGGEEAGNPGTVDAPLTVAEALTYIDGLGADNQSPTGFVKGKIVEISEISTQYGNATYLISDDGTKNNTLQVYRGLGLGGEKFTSEDAIKVGDDVIITGKMVNYKGNTKQFAQGSSIYSLNGKTAGENEEPEEPVITGDNILENGDFEAWTNELPNNWKSTNTASSATLTQSTDAHGGSFAVKVAHDASANKRLAYKELKLKAGTYQVSLYVKAADNAGASINPGYTTVSDKLTYNYDGYVNDIAETWQQVSYSFTLNAETEVNLIVMVPKNSGTDVIIDDFTLATDNGGIVEGGDTPDTPDNPTDEVKEVTIAEFNAAPESNDVWYKLTGTIKNLKEGDLYGNFDLEDATGSVYVYGVLSEKGGAKKLFQDLVAKYDLKEGSTITIIGTRGSYNGKIEVMNAYFVSAGSETPGGGDEPKTGADGSTIITIADFNAAAESTSVWYQLTGTIKNLKEGDLYGNFDLEDATGSVYVYGVLSEKGGAKKLFQDLVAKYGITNGSKITIVGNRGSYNGKIEVTNAYFISIE